MSVLDAGGGVRHLSGGHPLARRAAGPREDRGRVARADRRLPRRPGRRRGHRPDPADRRRWPRPHRFSVTFGEPLTFPEHRGKAGKGKARREVTDAIMDGDRRAVRPGEGRLGCDASTSRPLGPDSVGKLAVQVAVSAARPRRATASTAPASADVGGADLAAQPLAHPDDEAHGHAGAAELLQLGVHVDDVAVARREPATRWVLATTRYSTPLARSGRPSPRRRRPTRSSPPRRPTRGSAR